MKQHHFSYITLLKLQHILYILHVSNILSHATSLRAPSFGGVRTLVEGLNANEARHSSD